jgi:hypothetical protein
LASAAAVILPVSVSGLSDRLWNLRVAKGRERSRMFRFSVCWIACGIATRNLMIAKGYGFQYPVCRIVCGIRLLCKQGGGREAVGGIDALRFWPQSSTSIHSGGICAFNTAWHHPNAPGRALSHCGSLVVHKRAHAQPVSQLEST